MFIYCTYLTIYSGNKLPPFYIGHSTIERVESQGYNGTPTSKEYREVFVSERSENPHLFKTKIITKHKLRKEATEKEEYFLKRFDVKNNPLYFNKCNGHKDFCIQDKVSIETRQKQSKAKKDMILCKDSFNNKRFVTRDEFNLNPELVGHMKGRKVRRNKPGIKGYVVCKDTEGNIIRVTKEEFNSNPNLVGNTKHHIKKPETIQKQKEKCIGKVRCKDLDGNIFFVPKEEFNSNPNLFGLQKGRKFQNVTCPHCGKSGAGGNMTRYHFDNCKSFPD